MREGREGSCVALLLDGQPLTGRGGGRKEEQGGVGKKERNEGRGEIGGGMEGSREEGMAGERERWME